MALRVPQVLRGHKASYRLVEALKATTVFKAEILSDSDVKTGLYASSRTCWNDVQIILSAVVKTALDKSKIILNREHRNYKMPAIASCPYIRSLIDIIPNSDDAREESSFSATENPHLVFEWMEQDLRTVPSDEFRDNSKLPKLIAKSVLSGLALLKDRFNAVHTGGLFPA